MESSMLSPPNSASTLRTRRNKFFAPLSSHGMPKAPMSPKGSIRSHRFEYLGSPRSRSSSISSPPMTPMSFRAPMSPPMSAKSFGTFIESEPSTPGFSPRPSSSNWDSSTLVLLPPVSPAPSSPPEPEWEMMTPVSKVEKPLKKETTSPAFGLRITSDTSLSSHPTKPSQSASQSDSQKENPPPASKESPLDHDGEPKAEEEQPVHEDTLGKLATKMKSMLRRTTVREKKVHKRRRARSDELDYMEDVHWTEM